jgi:hypothetical protein
MLAVDVFNFPEKTLGFSGPLGACPGGLAVATIINTLL